MHHKVNYLNVRVNQDFLRDSPEFAESEIAFVIQTEIKSSQEGTT